MGACSARPCNSDGGAQSTRPSLWRRAGVGGGGGGGEGGDNSRAHACMWGIASVGNRFGQAAGGDPLPGGGPAGNLPVASDQGVDWST